jgi:hypothetical protein
MGRLLAVQAEMKTDINANITASQEKADADAKALHEKAAARQEKANAELKAAMHSMRSDVE